MNGTLAALALSPQPSKAHLQLVDLGQTLLVELTEPIPAVFAHGTLRLAFLPQRRLAAHACLGFLCEFHQTTSTRRGYRDGARVITRH